MMLRRKARSVTHRSIPSCLLSISTEKQQWSAGHIVATDEGKSFLVLAAGVVYQCVPHDVQHQSSRAIMLPCRSCIFQQSQHMSLALRSSLVAVFLVCTFALMAHRIRRHLAMVHSVWRTFAPRNAVAEDFDRHFTHVICQVICLVTCGTGLRWTFRIQSTAREIGASLIRRSRAFFNNGRWFGRIQHIQQVMCATWIRGSETCQSVAFSWLQKHIDEPPWTHRTTTCGKMQRREITIATVIT